MSAPAEPSPMQDSSSDASRERATLYAAYLDAVLDNEQVRRRDLQKRGIGIITTSSAVATLFFGVLTATGAKSAAVLRPAHLALEVAFGLFAAAAVAGIFSNLAPLHHDFAEGEKNELGSPAATSGEAAVNVVGWKLQRLTSTMRNNRLRAWAVTIALTFQAAGTALLAVTVITALTDATTSR